MLKRYLFAALWADLSVAVAKFVRHLFPEVGSLREIVKIKA
jgi:hypothetical protein